MNKCENIRWIRSNVTNFIRQVADGRNIFRQQKCEHNRIANRIKREKTTFERLYLTYRLSVRNSIVFWLRKVYQNIQRVQRTGKDDEKNISNSRIILN